MFFFVTSLSEIWYRKSAVMIFVKIVVVEGKALLKGVSPFLLGFTFRKECRSCNRERHS